MLTRRRVLSIAAAACAWPAAARTPLHVETGWALGTQVSLRLAHPEAPVIAAAALAEISRLEDIFSLYRPDSALSRLNAVGRLEAPPAELLECLSLAGAVYHASAGRFDPTIQPLWRALATAAQTGRPLSNTARRAALEVTGWPKVTLEARAISLPSGAALTLNGIAQGYVADRVATFLADRGLTNTLIDTGELRALGHDPRTGGPWPVRFAAGGDIGLAQRALATSAPLGMTFGGDGVQGHILDPRTGSSTASPWAALSVSSSSAALADAVSTAACLCDTRADVIGLCDAFPDTRLEAAHRA
ncbi:FAD:protein FMN transferase [Dinoroseobacter sp. PD6]|uniref:FAD:protein FMN transferase n=1 Tax=Dinoroseobacter sp. PD6 TaxID=3028384 RepID=UPI00237AAC37|nr:FAD:protein FMN transferase [Dinoroseobacter sp. PD6]MDD9717932.1 FAD:protein FMN transferase [Dinoroseobacter sp. PD6]